MLQIDPGLAAAAAEIVISALVEAADAVAEEEAEVVGAEEVDVEEEEDRQLWLNYFCIKERCRANF